MWRGPPEGLLRFDPGRDLGAVIDLLELGFGDELDAQDRRWLSDLAALSNVGPLLWLVRLFPLVGNAFSGFVWYADGRLVGNASLMRTGGDTWVIANVVTHPDYRRLGIGQGLTQAAIESARARGARRVGLQVGRHNSAAVELYRRLGFRRVFATATLRLPSVQEAARLDVAARDVQVVPWGRSGRARARRLLARAGRLTGESLHGPLGRALYGLSLFEELEDRLRGRRNLRWAAVEGGEYRAVLAACAERRGDSHRMEIVADARWRGRVEPPLVDRALTALARRGTLPVEARVRDVESGAIAALKAVGFRQVRTLERMVLDLG